MHFRRPPLEGWISRAECSAGVRESGFATLIGPRLASPACGSPTERGLAISRRFLENFSKPAAPLPLLQLCSSPCFGVVGTAHGWILAMGSHRGQFELDKLEFLTGRFIRTTPLCPAEANGPKK